MKFRTTVELGGKTATGLQVPEDVVAGLGTRKRQPVVVTINGHTYRSTVAPYNGVYMLPLSAEHREAAGVAAGDEIDVEIEVDDKPREVIVPPDLAEALAAEPKAAEFFEGLSFTNRNAIVVSVEGAKAAETRQRRITKAIEALREGRAR